jgi:hypothetical protein
MRKTITPYTLPSISVLSYYREVSEMGGKSSTVGRIEGFGGVT